MMIRLNDIKSFCDICASLETDEDVKFCGHCDNELTPSNSFTTTSLKDKKEHWILKILLTSNYFSDYEVDNNE